MKRRCIGERLQRAGSLAVRREVALDWAADWRREHAELLGRVHAAVGVNLVVGLLLGDLAAATVKRLGALDRIIEALSDEDAV